MRIVLWIGRASNQVALANKLSDHFELAGIIIESRSFKPTYSLKLLLDKIIEKIFIPEIGKAWINLQKNYRKNYPSLPDVNTLTVQNINSQKAKDFTLAIDPDIIGVSGTQLIRAKYLKLDKPVLNLHTGLSPYIKGGPNCTNWCLSKQLFHLIGNTIMWIDEGIDTGNILTSEVTPLNGKETLYEIHFKVMEHAHLLFLKALLSFTKGQSPNVKQASIATGRTFYTKEWVLKEKFNLKRNFKGLTRGYEDSSIPQLIKTINTVKI